MTRHDPARFLRLSLRGNAAFSTITGLSMLAASAPLAALLGVEPPALVASIGVNLWVFAAFLLWLASREEIRMALAGAIVCADLAWVAATAISVPLGVFTETGNWIVIAIAEVVFTFAILQWIGIRRVHRNPGPVTA